MLTGENIANIIATVTMTLKIVVPGGMSSKRWYAEGSSEDMSGEKEGELMIGIGVLIRELIEGITEDDLQIQTTIGREPGEFPKFAV